jgi:hypothetical protein
MKKRPLDRVFGSRFENEPGFETGSRLFQTFGFEQRGFPKTSVFGKAALILREKAGLRPLFREPFPKPTGLWE